MSRDTRSRGLHAALPLTVVLVLVAAALPAGDNKFQDSFGSQFFASDPACKAKQLPTFESLIPIPSFVDPFEQDLIPFFCQVQTSMEGKAKKGVKGSYTSELIVRDNRTGETESFPAGSGRFRTNRDGFDSFDFDIPSELFADGFESGDVSAWSYTRTDFTGRKQVNTASVSCGTSSSKSN